MAEIIKTPFCFFNLEFSFDNKGYPRDREILSFLCGTNESFDDDEFISRYKETMKFDGNILVVPADKLFVERFVNPLKFAKTNYVMGNYLGTISMIGAFAEMMTVFFCDLADKMFEGKEWIDKIDPKGVESFDRKGQERRINALLSAEVITDSLSAILEEIRQVRNRYVHSFLASHDGIRKDALRSYDLGLQLYIAGIGPRTEGSLLDGWKKGATVKAYAASDIISDYLQNRQ